MPLPNQDLSQHTVNINSFNVPFLPKYVFDQLHYPSPEDMRADVFLDSHPCFSKITTTSQGEYLLTCAVSAEKIIIAIANLDNPDRNIMDRAVEVLQSEFVKMTDSIRYVNSHMNVEFENQVHVITLIDYFLKSSIPLPLSFTYLNIVILEEKLMQVTKRIFDQLEEEKIKAGGEGVDKASLTLRLAPRMQDFGSLKRIQGELLTRHTRMQTVYEEDANQNNHSEAFQTMYS